MNKEDLKTGMILEFNDQSRGLMLDDEIFFIDSSENYFSGSRSRSCLNNRLEISGSRKVVKIFVPDTPKTTNIGYGLESFIFDIKYKKLVWERVNVKEMTIEQVQEKLGYKIKIVEGK